MGGIRFALRSLARSPGYTAAALSILFAAIAGNVAVFSVVYAVLLQPEPIRDLERVVVVWKSVPESNEPLIEVTYRQRIQPRSLAMVVLVREPLGKSQRRLALRLSSPFIVDTVTINDQLALLPARQVEVVHQAVARTVVLSVAVIIDMCGRSSP